MASATSSAPPFATTRPHPSSGVHTPSSISLLHHHDSTGLRLEAHSFSIKGSFFTGGSPRLLPSSFSQHRITMRTATKGAYICRDCGYIYNERKSFETLPDDFRCPVCYAPKRRFRPYDLPVAKNANQLDVRKARKEQLKQDASIGHALPIAIAIGAAALVGLYLYLNTQF